MRTSNLFQITVQEIWGCQTCPSYKNFLFLEGPGEFFTSCGGKTHNYPNKLSESVTFQIKGNFFSSFNFFDTVKLPTVTISKELISWGKGKHPHGQFTMDEHNSN